MNSSVCFLFCFVGLFFPYSQPFFSLHSLLSCSGKSHTLFKLNLHNDLYWNFSCSQQTDHFSVSWLTAAYLSCFLDCYSVFVMVLCYFASLCFSPSSLSASSALQWQEILINIFYLIKSSQNCIIIWLLCSSKGKKMDCTFFCLFISDGLNASICYHPMKHG